MRWRLRRTVGRLGSRVGPWGVLLGGGLLTIAVAIGVYRFERFREQTRFERRVDHLHAALEERVAGYTALLRGVVGLFAASREVEPDEFAAYVGGLRVREAYPGLLGLNYAAWVAPGAAASLEHAMQIEEPEFRVSPPLGPEGGAVVVYVAPRDLGNASTIGLNLSSERARQAAMDTARDARLHAEENVQISTIASRRLAALADAMPQIVFTADETGTLATVNRAWGPAEHELSKQWESRIHPEDRARIRVSWQATLDAGALWQDELRMRTAPGEPYRWHLRRARPSDGDEGAREWVGTLTDIQDQKCIEERLLKNQGELEDRVRTRTAALQSAHQEL